MQCPIDLETETGRAYSEYLAGAARTAERASPPSGPEIPWFGGEAGRRAEALSALSRGELVVHNFHEGSEGGAKKVSQGEILHWVGAVRMNVGSVETLGRTLSQYGRYQEWYAPMIAGCYGTPAAGAATPPSSPENNNSAIKTYRVVTILHDVVAVPLVPKQHFSFEVTALAKFLSAGASEGGLVVATHAESIRESDSGEPEKADGRKRNNDLLPAGRGHGILWRSDTFWRARMGNATSAAPYVYAEYEQITLARSLDAMHGFSPCVFLKMPLIRAEVLKDMTERPKQAVSLVLRRTKTACEAVAAGR